MYLFLLQLIEPSPSQDKIPVIKTAQSMVDCAYYFSALLSQGVVK